MPSNLVPLVPNFTNNASEVLSECLGHHCAVESLRFFVLLFN